MIHTLGELKSPLEKTELKMWSVEVPSGARPLQRHSHTRFEITFIEAGSGEYTTDSGSHPMVQGDMFIFSGNEFHCITQVGEAGLTITNLHFEPTLLSERLREEYPNLFFSHSPLFCNRIPAHSNKALRRSFFAVKREITQKETAYETAIASELHLLFLELIRHHRYAAETPVLQENLAKIPAYIDRHFSDPLTLEQLAGMAGISPHYFSGLFKKVFSISLWDYILSKRVEHAIHLILTDGERNMLEIAALCGFNNTANFNKQFKRLTGMTPTQYRRSKNQIIH